MMLRTIILYLLAAAIIAVGIGMMLQASFMDVTTVADPRIAELEKTIGHVPGVERFVSTQLILERQSAYIRAGIAVIAGIGLLCTAIICHALERRQTK